MASGDGIASEDHLEMSSAGDGISAGDCIASGGCVGMPSAAGVLEMAWESSSTRFARPVSIDINN